jgi:hypothetical protein
MIKFHNLVLVAILLSIAVAVYAYDTADTVGSNGIKEQEDDSSGIVSRAYFRGSLEDDEEEEEEEDYEVIKVRSYYKHYLLWSTTTDGKISLFLFVTLLITLDCFVS